MANDKWNDHLATYTRIQDELEKIDIDRDTVIVIGLKLDEHFYYVMSMLSNNLNNLPPTQRVLIANKLREIASELEAPS